MIASFDKVIETRIRALFKAAPFGKGFKSVDTVNAAAGIKLQLPATEGIIPGMPFVVITEKAEKLKEEMINSNKGGD